MAKRQEAAERLPAEYQRRISQATAAFFTAVDGWVRIEERPLAELDAVYHTVLRGAAPDRTFVVTGEPAAG